MDEKLTVKIYQCSVCKACEDICQVNIPLVEFWEELRHRLIGLGKGPMPAHNRMRDSIVKKFNLSIICGPMNGVAEPLYFRQG